MANRFYSLDDQDLLKFIQVPKSLFDNQFYKTLSLGAKMMYSILRDRQDLSIANEWLDKNGYIFFYYDCEKLAEYMGISTSTINRYKKELIEYELLIQRRQGQGNPNRLYILKPESIENTLISHFDSSRSVNLASLEVSKSLGSDTEDSETEKSETKTLHFDSELTLNFIEIYKEYFNTDYREIVNEPNLENENEWDKESLRIALYDFFYENRDNKERNTIEYFNTVQKRFGS